MQDRIFYSICFGFVFGVLLRSFVFVDFYTALLFSVISIALILLFGLVSKNKWGIIAGIFVLALSLGVLRFHIKEVLQVRSYDGVLGTEISTEGVMVDEPDIRETNQKLVIEESISGSTTKILVTTSLDEHYEYGDMVSLAGKIERPENFITDTGKVFDYVNYLRKDGIFYIMGYPEIEIISHDNGNIIKSTLFGIKNKFLSSINFAISEPESLLMSGLILGERSAFSQDLRQKFIDTGTIHVVALSGYNVTIVAIWIMKMFSFLPLTVGYGAGIFGIFLFVVMAGAQSTAIRAGIMACLVLMARMTGRNYDVARALALTGIVMVVLNPRILAFDVSFQLSFIATISIIFFSPKVKRHLLWVTPKWELREIISSTIAAYIFVLPFILYKMGNLSLVALPANALILPFIPFTMLLGFLTGFLGIIWYALAVPFGLLSQIILHYELSVIDFFSSFALASISIPNFPLIIVLPLYAYFIYMLFGKVIKEFFIAPL